MVQLNLNYGNILEYKKELDNYDDYLPLKLIPFSKDYYNHANKEALEKVHYMRDNIPGSIDEREEYFKKDIEDWLKHNPQFNDII